MSGVVGVPYLPRHMVLNLGAEEVDDTEDRHAGHNMLPEMKLARCAVQQIGTAHDIGDALRDIIDHVEDGLTEEFLSEAMEEETDA